MNIARTIVSVSSGLNRIALWGAVTAVAVMVCAALWQVVARYIFASPPIWTEELARYAMVWAGMLGASCSFYAGADPVLFPGALDEPGKKGARAAVLRLLIILVFCGPIIWFCFVGPNGTWMRSFIARAIARDAEMLGFSMFWITLAIPLAFSLICIHASAGVARRFLALQTQETNGV